jgi:hypothetical protein
MAKRRLDDIIDQVPRNLVFGTIDDGEKTVLSSRVSKLAARNAFLNARIGLSVAEIKDASFLLSLSE